MFLFFKIRIKTNFYYIYILKTFIFKNLVFYFFLLIIASDYILIKVCFFRRVMRFKAANCVCLGTCPAKDFSQVKKGA